MTWLSLRAPRRTLKASLGLLHQYDLSNEICECFVHTWTDALWGLRKPQIPSESINTNHHIVGKLLGLCQNQGKHPLQTGPPIATQFEFGA